MLNTAKIRQLRGTYSQGECAERGRLPGGFQAWSNIERGDAQKTNVKLDTLLALARGLRCSIADIVDEEYPPKRRAKRAK